MVTVELDFKSLKAEEREALSGLLEHLLSGRLPDQRVEVDPEALDPEALGTPPDWRPIVRFLRTAPFHDIPGVVGAGLGYRVRGGQTTEELAAVVLVKEKVPRRRLRAGACLPQEVTFDGVSIPIDVQVGFDPVPRMMAGRTRRDRTARTTHNRSGGPLSVQDAREPCANGTLTGVFDGECLTCAHVALGFGFQAFISNLPLSILWLFQSPRGAEMVSAAAQQVGQQLYRLFEVDSNLPVLVPFPSPLLAAGVLSLLYVDGAVGRQDPQPIPPFLRRPPGTVLGATQPYSYTASPLPLLPDRSTRWPGAIRSARLAWPGERVMKDGQTTGVTWGEVWLPFFQFYLPIPLGLVNGVVLFDNVLMRLDLAPGDSGSAILTDDSMHYLAMGNLGLPPGPSSFRAPAPTCPVEADDINALTLATPYYLHELLLGVDLS